MIIIMERWAKTPEGVAGRLGPWTTFELPDRGNRRGVSCIPAGQYTCRRRRYHAGGYDTWEIQGVPGRDHILFHKGNRVRDTEGCVLLGKRLGTLGGELAVLQSGEAFDEFMAHTAGADRLILSILER